MRHAGLPCNICSLVKKMQDIRPKRKFTERCRCAGAKIPPGTGDFQMMKTSPCQAIPFVRKRGCFSLAGFGHVPGQARSRFCLRWLPPEPSRLGRAKVARRAPDQENRARRPRDPLCTNLHGPRGVTFSIVDPESNEASWCLLNVTSHARRLLNTMGSHLTVIGSLPCPPALPGAPCSMSMSLLWTA